MSRYPALVVWLALVAALLIGALAGLKLAPTQRAPFQPDAFPVDMANGLDADPSLARLTSHRTLNAPQADAFDVWQHETRARILALGGSPVAPVGRAEHRALSERTLSGGVRQALIAFRSFDGTEIPAYLHVPSGAGRRPGILMIPGHVKEGTSGIEQLANDSDSYQHAAARLLAEQGYVTLAPELRGFGYLGQPFSTEHRLVAFNAILRGTSYKWIALRDLGAAMQVLRGLDDVDAERIGVSGASLGGELAVQYSALDPEVDAVVFQSHGGRHGVKQSVRGDARDQPHYCHVLPVIDRIVAQEHWYWLLAPRPVLGVRGSDNNPFDDSDRDLYGRGWSYLDATSNFELRVAEGGHEYFVEPAVEFFARVFGPGAP